MKLLAKLTFILILLIQLLGKSKLIAKLPVPGALDGLVVDEGLVNGVVEVVDEVVTGLTDVVTNGELSNIAAIMDKPIE
jgi:hypothetical protein